MSSVFIDSMIKHEICVDGSKMNRQHAYRILATRKKYSDHDAMFQQWVEK